MYGKLPQYRTELQMDHDGTKTLMHMVQLPDDVRSTYFSNLSQNQAAFNAAVAKADCDMRQCRGWRGFCSHDREKAPWSEKHFRHMSAAEIGNRSYVQVLRDLCIDKFGKPPRYIIQFFYRYDDDTGSYTRGCYVANVRLPDERYSLYFGDNEHATKFAAAEDVAKRVIRQKPDCDAGFCQSRPHLCVHNLQS